MNKKINILYIIDELNIGGTERQLLATIKLLNRKKFVPHLVCLRPSKYYFDCAVPCKKQVLGVSSLLSVNGFLKLLRLTAYLRKNSIDIVQTFFFDSTVFGVLAGRLALVKKVISCRRDMGFWYSPSLLRVLKRINVFVDRFLVNSFAIKENIIKLESAPEHKIDVIYNGISLEPFRKKFDVRKIRSNLRINPDVFVVGLVANLNRPVKRVDVFIKAAHRVLEQNEGVYFVIIGDGQLRQGLAELSSRLGIRDRIFFLGLKKNIQPYLAILDVGVISSDTEGFSNSILEYMATGLPIVCTEAGGNSEVIENGVNGFLIHPGDYRALAERIIQLEKDPGLCSKMGSLNLDKVKKFSWPTVINRTEMYYSNLVCEKS